MKWFCGLGLLFWPVLLPGQWLGSAVSEGGASPIDSDAPKRAGLAIERWSHLNSWKRYQAAPIPPLLRRDPVAQKRVVLDERHPQDEARPDYWDFDAVGRSVFLRIIKNDDHAGIIEAWLLNDRLDQFELFKTYQIAYYSGSLGPKEKEGDFQAPEGVYSINRRRMNPKSRYHLSMNLGYPNAYDRHHDRTGGFLMIHGKRLSAGCFAMTDESIEQLYTLVDAALRNGQPLVPVHCFPFPMTASRLDAEADSEHFVFWQNLKEGWDYFEHHRQPPSVKVKKGRYQFTAP